MTLLDCLMIGAVSGLMVMAMVASGGDFGVGLIVYGQWIVSMALFLALSASREDARETLQAMTNLLVNLLVDIFRDIDRMLKDERLSKDDALLRVRKELCSLMQIIISEPHRTSFAIPQPVDFMIDEFVARRVQERVALEMDNP